MDDNVAKGEKALDADVATLPHVTDSHFNERAFPLASVLAGVMTVLAIFTTIFAFPYRSFLYYGLTASIWWMAIFSLVGVWKCRGKLANPGIPILVGGILSGLGFLSLITTGFGLVLGFGAFILTSAIVIQTLPSKQSNSFIALGAATGIAIYLFDLLGTQSRLSTPPGLRYYLPYVIILLILVYLYISRLQFPYLSLAVKIALPFSILSLVSIVVATAYNINTTRRMLAEASSQSLPSETSSAFTSFLGVIQQSLATASTNLILLAIFVALLTSISAVVFSQFIIRPIKSLTKEAENIAKGNVGFQVPVESHDEIGQLSRAFNTMTRRLLETMENLETRVQERTEELAEVSSQAMERAAQLQVVSELARSIASIRDLEQLLPVITQTISERFGYYHVGIFLVDPKNEYAVLRASNSEGGQRMLERGHRLKVGQVGIVGYVTGRGEPRIASDVGLDAVYFNNPDLPQTRSEVALPLIVGGQLIGALDVQSREVGTFKEEDLGILSTLADQVAIAIENARLFSTTRQALIEAQTTQKEYLRAEWERVSAQQRLAGYAYSYGEISPLAPEQAKEGEAGMGKRQAGALAETVEESQEATKELEVPIGLRGQVIGLLKLQDQDSERSWSEEEINLVKSVADQVGLALENARLLETTRRRAEREYLVGQITTQLRATNDPKAILQTAVAELTRALHAHKVQVSFQPGTDQKMNERVIGDHQPESTEARVPQTPEKDQQQNFQPPQEE